MMKITQKQRIKSDYDGNDETGKTLKQTMIRMARNLSGQIWRDCDDGTNDDTNFANDDTINANDDTNDVNEPVQADLK